MKKIITTIALTLMMNQYMHAQNYKEITHKDKNGYTYITILNDQNNVRIYTLKNGLKVFLSKNTDAPRIQTYIPVRTGSNNDPKDNTGLAHYLEHMMFKGTSKIGTKDWQKEKALLKQISDLYEQHKAEKNPEKKKEIYKKIDQISQEASKYAIANEYDKAISSLGASGTNAHTWLDETVYKNNIPANELEKWFKIESERFSELVLRLFHTELEAVYEEYNRAQDNDYRLVNYELMDALFPTHPNGQQTTIGKSDHLKNPSMEAIHKYFNEYYVPNNYALVLVGDLDYDKTIALAEKYFGKFAYKDLPIKPTITEKPLESVVKRTVKSPTVQRLQIAWRTDSYGTEQARLAELCAQILSNNGEAGLIDLNINQKQTALRAAAFHSSFKQYGYISMIVVPKEGQTLDQAKALLLEQIEKLKKGDFPDWMIPAIVNDMKKAELKRLESADGLATTLYESYIKNRTWKQELEEIQAYERITKADVVKFANEFFRDNYVAVYKEKGVNDKLVRVENPGITPIQLNREDQSPFLKSILEEPTKDIKPEFVDFQKEIFQEKINGVKLSFVKNLKNNLAQMSYIFPFGTDNDKEWGIALQVAEYMGTDQYTPEALKQEFYKIGITYNIRVGADQISISLSGLEENLSKGIQLMNHWLKSIKSDEEIYKTVVRSIVEAREIGKKDKNRIMQALTNYAKYGKNSRFRDIVSQGRLESATGADFTQKVSQLLDYDYEIYFYGQDIEAFKKSMIQNGLGRAPQQKTLSVPAPKVYPEPATEGKVYFTNYDMVQVEMSKVGRADKINTQNFGKINVFNEYFGRGLSSIVFQEIREARSLAYSAYVSYSYPAELNRYDYVTNYIGTQANKLSQAVEAIEGLMKNLPQIPAQFTNAKNMALKQIASKRITRPNLFATYRAMQKWGLNHDVRADIYKEIETLKLDTLTSFYNDKVKPIKYNTAIIGKRENLDRAILSQMGDFVELSLEEIFGY